MYGLSIPQQNPALLTRFADALNWISLFDYATESALTIIFPLLSDLLGNVKSPMRVYFGAVINFEKVHSSCPICSSYELSTS